MENGGRDVYSRVPVELTAGSLRDTPYTQPEYFYKGPAVSAGSTGCTDLLVVALADAASL